MLVRPQPLPDELDRSYLGALMRFNGISNERVALRLITTWAGSAGAPQVNNAAMKLLSEVAGIDLPAFARSHSMLPLRRAVTSYDIDHGSPHNLMVIYNCGIGPIRPGAYLCHDCAWEDFHFHGRSYWRRDHQTPGLFWCPKHRMPLSVVRDETALLQPPTQVLDRAEMMDPAWTDDLQQDPLIARFLELCGVLMERPRPYFTLCIRQALRDAACARGLTGNPVKAGVVCTEPLLSDAMLDSYPAEWLMHVMPALGCKPRGIACHQVDDVLWTGHSAAAGFAYILALALLFNSSDEANMAVRSIGRRPNPRPIPKPNSIALGNAGAEGITTGSSHAAPQLGAATPLLAERRPERRARARRPGTPSRV